MFSVAKILKFTWEVIVNHCCHQNHLSWKGYFQNWNVGIRFGRNIALVWNNLCLLQLFIENLLIYIFVLCLVYIHISSFPEPSSSLFASSLQVISNLIKWLLSTTDTYTSKVGNRSGTSLSLSSSSPSAVVAAINWKHPTNSWIAIGRIIQAYARLRACAKIIVD